MKNRELIELLESQDPDDEVKGLSEEGDVFDITDVVTDRFGTWLDLELDS